MMRAMVLVIASLVLLPKGANAQPLNGATRGLAYANKACGDCHAVAQGQRGSPDLKAPTFESVANIPGMTGTALNVWLHSPHPTMPQLIINPDRIDDLAAYMATLKKKN